MRTVYEELETNFEGYYNFAFEPTISLFKNAVVFNYKKTGTRFFREISSYPNDINLHSKQLDLSFRHTQFNESLGDINKLQYKFKNLYVYTILDDEYGNENIKNSFGGKNHQKQILLEEGVNSFQELILNNENKNIVFVIKSPIKRFFSGLVQIVAAYRDTLLNNEKELNLLKFTSGLSDTQIRKFCKNYNLNEELQDTDEGKEILDIYIRILMYILEYRWELILGDIHTENYLKNYHDLINNISDKSKIKVIDLEDCNTQSALNFFCDLRGDTLLEGNWTEFVKSKQESNYFIYKKILDTNFYRERISKSPIFSYLKNEQLAYLELKESKYFVKI